MIREISDNQTPTGVEPMVYDEDDEIKHCIDGFVYNAMLVSFLSYVH